MVKGINVFSLRSFANCTDFEEGSQLDVENYPGGTPLYGLYRYVRLKEYGRFRSFWS